MGVGYCGRFTIRCYCNHIEAGRAGAKGPIRYPIVMGILHQLLGMSVSIPLLWVPAYISGRGNGPVSVKRVYASVPMAILSYLLSAVVFAADTDSYMWKLAAGILGGPSLAIASGFLT